MKKFVLLFALLGVVSLTVNAQSCSHAKKASADKTASLVSMDDAMADDASVSKRVCQKSGTVSYVRKNVCSESGKVSYADVEYCTKSGKFVNVSPSEGMGDEMTAKTVSGSGSTTAKKGCCAGKGAKASCSKGSKGASASAISTGAASTTTAKKACCASKTSCSKGAKAAKTTTISPAKTKLVKAEQE